MKKLFLKKLFLKIKERILMMILMISKRSVLEIIMMRIVSVVVIVGAFIGGVFCVMLIGSMLI